tara:strand:+ start:252 stop:545 length:294 start_codon:yes stop_codon:yes gene_type:complete
MKINSGQEELLHDAVAETIAYYIHKEQVLEMIVTKVAEIPELDSLNAELLADAFDCMKVDVGTLMSGYIKSEQTHSMVQMNHDLARRRVDRLDEHGR